MAVDEEISDYLRLINTQGIGAIGCNRLLTRYGSVDKALAFVSLKKQTPSCAWANEEIRKTRDFSAEIIIKSSPFYPQRLLKLHDAPPLLYAKGNLELLNHAPTVAMVGTRNASIMGRKIISKLAYDLTENNVLIISGMARGIDSAAHKGAMYAQNQFGPTVAVLGTGIDKIYPKENEILYQQIARQGLLISEYPMSTPAQTGNFPRRNRIVAALADAVVVGEATHKSGSLITAKLAADYGKMLFAIPGSPGDARSEGPNFLLRNGASWGEKCSDILNGLKQIVSTCPLVNRKPQENDLFTNSLDNLQKTVDIPPVTSADKNLILEYLSAEGCDADELIRLCKTDAQSLAMVLIELEMEDKIVRLPGNKIALTGKRRK